MQCRRGHMAAIRRLNSDYSVAGLAKLKHRRRNPDFGDSPTSAAKSLVLFLPTRLIPGFPNFCGTFNNFRRCWIGHRLVANLDGVRRADGDGQINFDICGHVALPRGLIR